MKTQTTGALHTKNKVRKSDNCDKVLYLRFSCCLCSLLLCAVPVLFTLRL